MLAAERRRKILQYLQKYKSVRVSGLSDEFGVAAETIRRDLKILAADGLVEKTHGGAVLAQNVHVANPYDLRQIESRIQKQSIAQYAASLVHDGDTVIIDNGTTAMEIARRLRGFEHITVITTSPFVAAELVHCGGVKVIMTGGVLDRDSKSLVGPDAERFLRRFRADIAFVGISGVSIDRGFTASNVYDAQMKEVMVDSADRVCIVADGSKLGVNSLVSFAGFDQVWTLITDESAPLKIVSELQKAGLDIRH